MVAGAAAAGVVAGGALQAGAAQGIASAQASQAQKNQDLALSYAAPSAAEIQQLQSSASLQAQNISRTQQLLSSSDPALIELGHQTLSMLQGNTEVGSNKYLRQDLDDQREKLQQSLAKQYGSGYASTSLGIQALNDFNRKADSTLQSANQSQINTNMGTLAGISATGQLNNISAANSLAGLYGNIQTRQTNAALGTGAQLYQSAGSQYAGQASIGNTLAGASSTALGYFAGAAGKADASKVTT
jgi:hypothetical protein